MKTSPLLETSPLQEARYFHTEWEKLQQSGVRERLSNNYADPQDVDEETEITASLFIMSR